MGSDPSYEMQRAIYAALSGSSDLKALIGNPARVYDRPPANPTFPYVTLGDDQILGEDVAYTEDSTVHVTIHVWSRSTDRGEAKRIGGVIRDILIAPIAIQSHRIVYGKYNDGMTKEEPDGLTWHRILNFEFRTQPTA